MENFFRLETNIITINKILFILLQNNLSLGPGESGLAFDLTSVFNF